MLKPPLHHFALSLSNPFWVIVAKILRPRVSCSQDKSSPCHAARMIPSVLCSQGEPPLPLILPHSKKSLLELAHFLVSDYLLCSSGLVYRSDLTNNHFWSDKRYLPLPVASLFSFGALLICPSPRVRVALIFAISICSAESPGSKLKGVIAGFANVQSSACCPFLRLRKTNPTLGNRVSQIKLANFEVSAPHPNALLGITGFPRMGTSSACSSLPAVWATAPSGVPRFSRASTWRPGTV